jgi:beta-glucosidase
MRPKKELKGFDKVFLKSGEQKTVELKIKVKDLAFYDEKTASWKIEPGEFVLHVATSAAAIVSSLVVTIK